MTVRFVRRFSERAVDLWRRARREHSTPREIGWSIAIGVFCGCTPFIGLHMWMALGLSTLFRLNRLWSFVGSRVSTSVMFSLLAFVEIELGHRVRRGVWVPLVLRDVLGQAQLLFRDWLLGSAIVGAVLGALLGLAAYVLARRWPVSSHTPGGSRPPTSESQPSTPRAPTA